MVPMIDFDPTIDIHALGTALTKAEVPVFETNYLGKCADDALKFFHDSYPDILIGVHGVDQEQIIDHLKDIGVSFVVTSAKNVVNECISKDMAVIAECKTQKDVVTAIKDGVTTLKTVPGLIDGFSDKVNSEESLYVLLNCDIPSVITIDLRGQATADIERILTNAINKLLDLTLAHVGVNDQNDDQAMKDAERLCKLFGWTPTVYEKCVFAGKGFEVMKKPFKGENGHISVGCKNILQAKWHLEYRGFAFDEDSRIVKNGNLRAIYFEEQIGGFAFHLMQK